MLFRSRGLSRMAVIVVAVTAGPVTAMTNLGGALWRMRGPGMTVGRFGARKANTRAPEGNGTGQDRTKQREKDDCLMHLSPSSG